MEWHMLFDMWLYLYYKIALQDDDFQAVQILIILYIDVINLILLTMSMFLYFEFKVLTSWYACKNYVYMWPQDKSSNIIELHLLYFIIQWCILHCFYSFVDFLPSWCRIWNQIIRILGLWLLEKLDVANLHWPTLFLAAIQGQVIAYSEFAMALILALKRQLLELDLLLEVERISR